MRPQLYERAWSEGQVRLLDQIMAEDHVQMDMIWQVGWAQSNPSGAHTHPRVQCAPFVQGRHAARLLPECALGSCSMCMQPAPAQGSVQPARCV